MKLTESLPVPSLLGNEFLTWLWWKSETGGGHYNFEHESDAIDGISSIDIWVDERIAMRFPDSNKIVAVMTGENPSAAPESKTALAHGKVLQELRLGIRLDDREFILTLKGPSLDLQRLKLPQVVVDGGQEVMLDRLALLEETDMIIGLLFADFSRQRITERWHTHTAPDLARWLSDL